jgi:transposase InsO family protein
LCRVADVSESGYYKSKKAVEKDKDIHLYDRIKMIKQGYKESYGYRKVSYVINEGQEKKINHKKIYRVMVKYGLLSKIRRKKSSNYRNFGERLQNIYENKLNRAFKQEEKNKAWMTDITEYKSKEGVVYISVLMDCYRSRILGYKYSTNNNVDLVLLTVKEAIKQREKHERVLLHSDRGFQYSGLAYAKVAQENNIELSMSAAATPKDNAPMESFFSSLKIECLYKKKPKTIEETKRLIDEYARYYNNERLMLKYNGCPCSNDC